MAVYSNSRYAFGISIQIESGRFDDGRKTAFLYDRENIAAQESDIETIHTVIGGERLDQIAYKYSGDSTLWWVIADINEIYAHPFSLKSNTKLKIPTRQIFEAAKAGRPI